jgi:hypothetical protein
MNTVVDVSINQGAPLNCCTYIDSRKKLKEISGAVDGSIKQGGGGAGCEGGGGGVGVGGKQSVKVWDKFECAAGARLCL